MRKKKENTKSLNLALKMILAAVVIVVAGFFVYLVLHNVYLNKLNNYEKEIINDGFYPVREVFLVNGYKEEGDYIFNKDISGKVVAVKFDFQNNVCSKNNYEFSLENVVRTFEGKYYVKKEKLEAVLNIRLRFDKDQVVSDEITFNQHEWTEFPALIAHSGGTVREKHFNSYYTNSLEALVSNYNLGHRIFEFDFYLTSDNKLAAVHDWDHFGHMDGVALSSEEWKNFQAFGMPMTDGRYTTMFIEDILDEMMVNKDIFIVTDTKLTQVSDESRMQFQLIYDEAMKRSPELLNRIIPQIYNEEMYDMVMSIYNFPSIIYTAYATSSSSEEIINFSNQHDNIKVITAPFGDGRFDKGAIDLIHEYDMLLYNHTIQAFEDMTVGRARGVDGFYTGLLLPEDYILYQQLEK